MVVFTEIQTENDIVGSYILQLKTEASHYLGVGDVGIVNHRLIAKKNRFGSVFGVRRWLIFLS